MIYFWLAQAYASIAFSGNFCSLQGLCVYNWGYFISGVYLKKMAFTLKKI